MPLEPPRLAGLVLAAGAASRFGAPKQLAVLGGEALVARAVRLATGCCDAGVLVVTGAHAAAVADVLAGSGAGLVRNSDWQDGMATSLACGVGALPADAAACLVMLCDQPGISAADLQGLRAAWQRDPDAAAAAAYAGVLGVPAIFPVALWPQLRALRGDRGARRLLAGLERVTAVSMPQAALDIDTVADLERMSPA